MALSGINKYPDIIKRYLLRLFYQDNKDDQQTGKVWEDLVKRLGTDWESLGRVGKTTGRAWEDLVKRW